MFAAASSILNWGIGGVGRGSDEDNNGQGGRSSNNSSPGMFIFASTTQAGGDDDDDDDDDNVPFEPSIADVVVTKAMLGWAGNLPLELVDSIIDLAEYWPHSSVKTSSTVSVPSRSFSTSANNVFLCRTPPLGFRKVPTNSDAAAAAYSTTPLDPLPLPRPDPAHPGYDSACLPETIRSWLPAQQAEPLEHPCRKIVFTIVSHDQGWANNHRRDRGTYEGSYTWFDVGLERFGRTTEPPQANDPGRGGAPGTSSIIPHDVKLYTISPAVVEKEASHVDDAQYLYSVPLLPGADRLQSNRVATREWTEHKIVWSWTDGRGRDSTRQGSEGQAVRDGADGADGANGADGVERTETTDEDREEDPLEKAGRGSATGDGKFVRDLCIGDVVTVWAKARFPGWVNTVQSVKVDVYWAV